VTHRNTARLGRKTADSDNLSHLLRREFRWCAAARSVGQHVLDLRCEIFVRPALGVGNIECLLPVRPSVSPTTNALDIHVGTEPRCLSLVGYAVCRHQDDARTLTQIPVEFSPSRPSCENAALSGRKNDRSVGSAHDGAPALALMILFAPPFNPKLSGQSATVGDKDKGGAAG